MTHPKKLLIEDFSYDLPTERIAKYPLAERDKSKLLIYKNESISEDIYSNIASHLPANTLLVFNNTKVVQARLIFKKPTGGEIEIFCLEPADQYADITTAMLQTPFVLWKCLVGGASKWKHGVQLEKTLVINQVEVQLKAGIHEKLSDCFVIKLEWQPGSNTFADILQQAGIMPLPPYLNRTAEEEDRERYQTIYATEDGSVAAPTAGLHFTKKVFDSLATKNITTAFVTLHVGAGTFKPVKSNIIAGHEMHAEFIDVPIETIKNLLKNLEGNIIAVGTTSLRTLESLYWLGIKVAINPRLAIQQLAINQWEVYELPQNILPKTALQNLVDWMESNKLDRLLTKTQILIAPGYSLKIARAIITNFHQPQSTLLLLIAAIVGNDWKNIYHYAMQNDFRFLSYGDGCLLFAADGTA